MAICSQRFEYSWSDVHRRNSSIIEESTAISPCCILTSELILFNKLKHLCERGEGEGRCRGLGTGSMRRVPSITSSVRNTNTNLLRIKAKTQLDNFFFRWPKRIHYPLPEDSTSARKLGANWPITSRSSSATGTPNSCPTCRDSSPGIGNSSSGSMRSCWRTTRSLTNGWSRWS